MPNYCQNTLTILLSKVCEKCGAMNDVKEKEKNTAICKQCDNLLNIQA